MKHGDEKIVIERKTAVHLKCRDEVLWKGDITHNDKKEIISYVIDLAPFCK